MIELPYWVNLLIVIGGLASAYWFGWSGHRNKYEREHIRELEKYTQSLLDLKARSLGRDKELERLIADVAEHFRTCPEVRKTSESVEANLITNPVTGAPLGYTYPVHNWIEPDDRP